MSKTYKNKPPFDICNLKFVIYLLFVICYLSFGFWHSTYAASFGLSIYPPVTQISIKPGTTITQVISFQNLSDTNKEITPNIVPFKPENDMGHAQLLPGARPDWLSFFSLANSLIELGKPFTIPAGKKDQLVLNIRIPASAALGDYYASVLLSSTPDNSKPNSTGANISGSIAAHLLISVTTTADPATVLKFQNFDLTSARYFKIDDTYFVDNMNPVSFTAKISNVGKYLSEIHGLFTLRQSKDQNPKHLIPIQPSYILANSEKTLLASPSGQISFKPSFTTIGLHTAEIAIRTPNASANSTIKLFFIPVKLTLAVLITITLLIILILKTNPPSKY